MKVHRFSVLSIAGVFLLAGGAFGAELRWKKPGSIENEPAVSSVLRIPTVISTDDAEMESTIVQVQAIEPMQPPRTLLQPPATLSDNPPPGATFQSAPPQPSMQSTPGEERFVLCDKTTLSLKSIKEISYDIRPTRTGQLPEECIMESEPFYGRHFSQTCFHWKASALSTKGAYFEDVQLERYGHSRCPALQPIVSGAKFIATIPLLPYRMAVTPPSECVYTLGHFRSGNRSPYIREPSLISPY